MTVKTWQNRTHKNPGWYDQSKAMQAEIDDLRNALAAWENQPAVATSTGRNTADFWTEIEVGTDLYAKPKEAK